jgi:hypothetical protein
MLHQIEGAMERHGISPTSFSLAVGRDPKLVVRMRAGRAVGPRIEAQIGHYIAALDAGTIKPPPRRTVSEKNAKPPRVMSVSHLPAKNAKPPRVMSVSHLPAITDSYEANARRDAKAANAAFLAALAKVRPVGDAVVAPEPRFARLPPPSLNCGANS